MELNVLDFASKSGDLVRGSDRATSSIGIRVYPRKPYLADRFGRTVFEVEKHKKCVMKWKSVKSKELLPWDCMANKQLRVEVKYLEGHLSINGILRIISTFGEIFPGTLLVWHFAQPATCLRARSFF